MQYTGEPVQLLPLPPVQAAKLLVKLRDAPLLGRKVSTSSKKLPAILYWGLVPMFDHRYEGVVLRPHRFSCTAL